MGKLGQQQQSERRLRRFPNFKVERPRSRKLKCAALFFAPIQAGLIRT
jgi:hypothetical protein